MFADSRDVEQRYFQSSGVFPIMHAVAVRRELVDANPWLLSSLYKAFIEARDRSVARARDTTVSYYPVPWMAAHIHEAAGIMSSAGELWPYGIKANRRTLEAFLEFGLEQGVLATHLDVENLFASAVEDTYRI